MTRPPDHFHTARLLLRRWRPADAAALGRALDASVAQLRPWIPAAVAEPAPLPILEARLAASAAWFDAGREWVYGIFPLGSDAEVLGGFGLYPRDATGRVPREVADRLELGYWLRAGATGRGFATEAGRAALEVAAALPGYTHFEIRCDPRNEPSVAVARRLGFRHERTTSELAADGSRRETMLWTWTPPAAPREAPPGR